MVRFETKTSWAAEQIRRAIINGRLRPGERLRIHDWAARLEISPTPLREALKALEAEGYLEITPHRGAQVAPFSPSDFAIAGRLTRALDGIATEAAVLQLDPPRRETLCTQLTRLNQSLIDALAEGNLDGAARSNRRFHQAIDDAASSPLLARVREPVHTAFPVARPILWEALEQDAGRRATFMAEHERIIAAIASGDAGAARREAEEHIDSIVSLYSIGVDEDGPALIIAEPESQG